MLAKPHSPHRKTIDANAGDRVRTTLNVSTNPSEQHRPIPTPGPCNSEPFSGAKTWKKKKGQAMGHTQTLDVVRGLQAPCISNTQRRLSSPKPSPFFDRSMPVPRLERQADRERARGGIHPDATDPPDRYIWMTRGQMSRGACSIQDDDHPHPLLGSSLCFSRI